MRDASLSLGAGQRKADHFIRTVGARARRSLRELELPRERRDEAGEQREPRQALAPVIPARSERATVHKIIYDELCKDLVLEESRRTYEGVAASLVAAGADSLILGCTEIGMLLDRTNVAVPVYDTTLVHCERAIEEALRGL